MAQTSTQGNTQANTAQQQVVPSTPAPQLIQQPDAKQVKATKAPASPADGLAAVAMIVAIGIFAGYFPDYAHTPAIRGLCLLIAYVCYSIGFLGGCLELGKLSKSQFWDSFGIGIIAALLCFGVNWLADITNGTYALSLSIRILMIVPLSLATYGVVRGILYLVIKDDPSTSASQQGKITASQPISAGVKERLKPEQVAGIVIAVLSVATAVIQALPSLLPLLKQILHLP